MNLVFVNSGTKRHNTFVFLNRQDTMLKSNGLHGTEMTTVCIYNCSVSFLSVGHFHKFIVKLSYPSSPISWSQLLQPRFVSDWKGTRHHNLWLFDNHAVRFCGWAQNAAWLYSTFNVCCSEHFLKQLFNRFRKPLPVHVKSFHASYWHTLPQKCEVLNILLS